MFCSNKNPSTYVTHTNIQSDRFIIEQSHTALGQANQIFVFKFALLAYSNMVHLVKYMYPQKSAFITGRHTREI